jgi:predicted site-specific integrase-resolvase
MEELWLMPTGLAALRLGLSRERVIQLCDEGRLEYIRDASGRRLIPEDAIARLERTRQRAKSAL